MSSFEELKSQFDNGNESIKEALVNSIKTVMSQENVSIELTDHDQETSESKTSELKFPLYGMELIDTSHHLLFFDVEALKGMSTIVEGVEIEAEPTSEDIEKIQSSFNDVLKDSSLSSQDATLSLNESLPSLLESFKGISSTVKLALGDASIDLEYFMFSSEASEQVSVSSPEFANLNGDSSSSGPTHNMQMLMDVELEVQVELGRKNIKIQDVMSLGKGSVIELDKNAGEPLELYINDTKLAEGEVVVVEDHFGIKITQLISPNERMKSLS